MQLDKLSPLGTKTTLAHIKSVCRDDDLVLKLKWHTIAVCFTSTQTLLLLYIYFIFYFFMSLNS